MAQTRRYCPRLRPFDLMPLMRLLLLGISSIYIAPLSFYYYYYLLAGKVAILPYVALFRLRNIRPSATGYTHTFRLIYSDVYAEVAPDSVSPRLWRMGKLHRLPLLLRSRCREQVTRLTGTHFRFIA